MRSPRRSAGKHTAAVEFSPRSVRQILHEEFKFYTYKLALGQEPNPRDFVARENACEALLSMPDEILIFFSDEAHFYLSQAGHALLEPS